MYLTRNNSCIFDPIDFINIQLKLLEYGYEFLNKIIEDL